MDERILKKKERWKAFYAGDPKVKHIYSMYYYGDYTNPPMFSSHQAYLDTLDWRVEKYFEMVKRMDKIDDDAIPYLDMLTGTEIFGAAFGCDVHYFENERPMAMPMIESVEEISKVKVPNIWDTSLHDYFEMAYKLRERTDKDAIFRRPDTQSPMDIGALVMNKTEFLMATITDPEAVEELTSKTRELLVQFTDAWIHEFGEELIAHFPDYYLPYGITLSDDEAGCFNADTYEELCLPNMKFLAERYGQMGIHCCANARHQWDNFKKIPNLAVLNIAQPGEVCVEALPFFAEKCAQAPGAYGIGDTIEDWKATMPENARVIFQPWCFDEADALDKLKRMKETFGD